MPKEKGSSTQLVLVNHASLGRIHIDMEAFFDFSFWLAEELEDLVANWKHTAVRKTAFDRRSVLPGRQQEL